MSSINPTLEVKRSTNEKNQTLEKISLTAKNLSGPVKKFLITAFCLRGIIAFREILGFENTAITIMAIFTAMLSSLAIIFPFPHEYYCTIEELPSQIRKKAFFLGSFGFIISLVAIGALESSFQMTQVMRSYIG